MIPPKVLVHHKYIAHHDLDRALIEIGNMGYVTCSIQPAHIAEPSRLWVTAVRVENIVEKQRLEEEERQRLMQIFPPHLREPLKLGSLEDYKNQ